jgi:hypothetical protein
MRIVIKEKKKSDSKSRKPAKKDKKDLLIDEVETQSDCEKKGGEFCYMHPKTQPKPAKTVELKEGVFGLTRSQIQSRNRKELNDLLRTVEMPFYSRLQEVIESFTQEEFDVLMTSPIAVQRLLELAE